MLSSFEVITGCFTKIMPLDSHIKRRYKNTLLSCLSDVIAPFRPYKINFCKYLMTIVEAVEYFHDCSIFFFHLCSFCPCCLEIQNSGQPAGDGYVNILTGWCRVRWAGCSAGLLTVHSGLLWRTRWTPVLPAHRHTQIHIFFSKVVC